MRCENGRKKLIAVTFDYIFSMPMFLTVKSNGPSISII